MEKPKKITLAILAGMMNRSFTTLDKKIDLIREEMATKVELQEVKNTLENRLDKIEHRLEGVEQKVSFSYDNRMTRVEEDVRAIKTKLEL